MKKTMLIALLAVVLVHVEARPAFAQAGIIRWIAKLSGPGPYTGVGYELYPFCIGKKTGRTRVGGGSGAESKDLSTAPMVPAWDLNCRSFSRNEKLVIFGAQVTDLWGDNDLQYDASVSPEAADTVHAKLVLGTADVSLATGRVGLGVGIGFIHFINTPAGSFTHPMYEFRTSLNIVPIVRGSADMRSLSPRERNRQDWVQLRLSVNVVPGGLDDSDFGALPGTFPRTDTEVTVRPSLVFNLGNLFDW